MEKNNTGAGSEDEWMEEMRRLAQHRAGNAPPPQNPPPIPAQQWSHPSAANYSGPSEASWNSPTASGPGYQPSIPPPTGPGSWQTRLPNQTTESATLAAETGNFPQSGRRPGFFKALFNSGVIILVALALAGYFLVSGLTERGRLDKEALLTPLITEGQGGFADENTTYWLAVNGFNIYLTEPFYFGMLNEIVAPVSATSVYIKVAYLPNYYQAVAAQIFDRKGGKLIAQYSEVPDPKEGYKATLYERYSIMDFLLPVIVLVGGVIIAFAIFISSDYSKLKERN